MKRILAILIIFIIGILFFKFSHQTKPVTSNLDTSQNQISAQPQNITLTLLGDVMMDRGVKRSVEKKFGGDYNALFKNTSYLKDSDITFANLEGSVAYGGHNVGSIYSFHMDPKSLQALKQAGINIVSFANNHVGDWSRVAFDESLEHLKDNQILYAGAGVDYKQVTTPAIIEVRGKKIGFLASTDVGPNWLAAKIDSPGILLASDPNLSKIITEAKKQVDYLIVSFHFGNEYSPTNSRQVKLAHLAIDNGADIVVGAHPHVMQRIEWYKNKPIFYSLGNFIFDQYFSPHTLEGMIAFVSINPKTGQITSQEKISTQDQNFIPQVLTPFSPNHLITKTFSP